MSFPSNSNHSTVAPNKFFWKIPKTIPGKSPTARWGHSSTLISQNEREKLVFFGGWDGKNMLNDCYVYDIDMKQWIIPQMQGKIPSPRGGHTMNIISSQELLLLQGGDGQHYLSDVYLMKFDLETKNNEIIFTWSQPKVTSDVKVYIKDDLIVNESIMHSNNNSNNNGNTTNTTNNGNTSPTTSLPSVVETAEISNTGFGTPTQKTTIDNSTVVTVKELYPMPRSRHTSVTLFDSSDGSARVFLFGGGGKAKIFNDLWVLELKSNIKWSQPKQGTKPPPRWGHSACLASHMQMFVFGGVNESGKMLNDLWQLDLTTFVWKQVEWNPSCSVVPVPRAAHTCTFYMPSSYQYPQTKEQKSNSFLFILWGGDDHTYLDDVVVYDIEKSVAKRIKFKTPKARCGHSASLFNSHLFVFGGGETNTRFKELYLLDLDLVLRKCGWLPPLPSMLAHHRQSSEDGSHVLEVPPTPPVSFEETDYMYIRADYTIEEVKPPAPSPPQTPAPPTNSPNIIPKAPPIMSTNRAQKQRSSTRSKTNDLQIFSSQDVKEITNWLVSLGLGRYAALFVAEEIDMECVPLLTEADLFRIGVVKYGPRKKILAASRARAEDLKLQQQQQHQHQQHNHTGGVEGEGANENSGSGNPSSPSADVVTSNIVSSSIPPAPASLFQINESISNLAMTCESLKTVISDSVKTLSQAMAMLANSTMASLLQQQQQLNSSNSSATTTIPNTPPIAPTLVNSLIKPPNTIPAPNLFNTTATNSVNLNNPPSTTSSASSSTMNSPRFVQQQPTQQSILQALHATNISNSANTSDGNSKSESVSSESNTVINGLENEALNTKKKRRRRRKSTVQSHPNTITVGQEISERMQSQLQSSAQSIEWEEYFEDEDTPTSSSMSWADITEQEEAEH